MRKESYGKTYPFVPHGTEKRHEVWTKLRVGLRTAKLGGVDRLWANGEPSALRLLWSYFPVPVRVTDWGEALPVSVMVSLAVNAAAVAGVKATRTVQLAAGASVAVQLLTSRKSVGLAPVMAMEVR